MCPCGDMHIYCCLSIALRVCADMAPKMYFEYIFHVAKLIATQELNY